MTLLAPEIAGIGYFPHRMDGVADAAHAYGAGSGWQCLGAFPQPVNQLSPSYQIGKVSGRSRLPQQKGGRVIKRFYFCVTSFEENIPNPSREKTIM
jgi:hypothetical protein